MCFGIPIPTVFIAASGERYDENTSGQDCFKDLGIEYYVIEEGLTDVQPSMMIQK